MNGPERIGAAKAKAKHRVEIRIIRANGKVENVDPFSLSYGIKITFKEVIKKWLQFIQKWVRMK